MKRYIISVLIILLSISNLSSQDRWIQIDYSTTNTGKNGLVGQWIECIYQDHIGNIWIGTASGISVWNGASWKSYTEKEGLLVNEVHDIIEDSENNIWIGYGSYLCGVSKLNGETWEHFDTSSGLIDNKVNSIFKDKEGYLWFATNGGISKYKDNTWTNFTTDNGLLSNRITKISQDSNGAFLIGTIDKGLIKYNGSQFVSFTWETNPRGFVNDVSCDSKGNVWVGGYGLHKYSSGIWMSVNPFPEGVYGYVNEIKEDSRGYMYFITNEGLSVLKGDTWSYITKDDGLPTNDLHNIFIKDDNCIMVGSTQGVGIFDGTEWSLIQTSNSGLISNDINYIFKDNDKTIWFCTFEGISRYKDYSWESFIQTPDGDLLRWVECGHQDKQGNIWFGSVHGVYKYNSNGWTVYKKDEGWVKNIVEEKDGTLWFSTNNDGVYKFDGNNWVTITEAEGLLSNSTDALFKDLHDNIWVGTSNGASKWNGNQFVNYPLADTTSGGSISSFTEDNKGKIIGTTYKGLFTLNDNTWERVPNSPICWCFDSHIDMNNTLWFGSLIGLFKFDGENWTNYTTNDGLINNVIQCVFREKNNGVFWFGTRNGVSSLIPDVVARVATSLNANSKGNLSLKIDCEGITQPFQFSLNGGAYSKNGGLFENLEDGYYNIRVTNAYDTIKIENVKIGNPITNVVNELEDEIVVFPNPSTGNFYFKNISGKLELYDIQGRKLLEKIISVEDNTLNISEFNRGIYIVRIKGKRGLIVKN